MDLKELRKTKGLTQKQCAEHLNIPLRTYINYENDKAKASSIKYKYMMEQLALYGFVDEYHGILSTEAITDICEKVFAEYPVDYCYLFGSYAKGKARDESDVDLLVSTPLTGFEFYELVEKLRCALHKEVDLLNHEQLKDNFPLLQEILKDGIKIYGQ